MVRGLIAYLKDEGRWIGGGREIGKYDIGIVVESGGW